MRIFFQLRLGMESEEAADKAAALVKRWPGITVGIDHGNDPGRRDPYFPGAVTEVRRDINVELACNKRDWLACFDPEFGPEFLEFAQAYRDGVVVQSVGGEIRNSADWVTTYPYSQAFITIDAQGQAHVSGYEKYIQKRLSGLFAALADVIDPPLSVKKFTREVVNV